MKIDFISDINKDNYEVLHYDKIDGFMVKTLWWTFAILSLYIIGIYFFKPASIYPSPFSWRNLSLSEVIYVMILLLIPAIVMTFLKGRLKNHYIYRFLMANALFVGSYAFVFLTGGSIEAHFHFFIMFGLLILYFDWRLGWWAIVAVALHHGILNYISPSWVYFYGRNDVAFSAHALLVLVMAIFTTKICEDGRKSIELVKNVNIELDSKVKERTKELEIAKVDLENKVKERTKELSKIKENLEVEVDKRTKELKAKVDELERFNKMAVGRELKVRELKKRIEELEAKKS